MIWLIFRLFCYGFFFSTCLGFLAVDYPVSIDSSIFEAYSDISFKMGLIGGILFIFSWFNLYLLKRIYQNLKVAK